MYITVVIILLIALAYNKKIRQWRFRRQMTRKGYVLIDATERDPFGDILPIGFGGPSRMWVHESTVNDVRDEAKRCFELTQKLVDRINTTDLNRAAQGQRQIGHCARKVAQDAYDQTAQRAHNRLTVVHGVPKNVADVLIRQYFGARF